LTKKGLELGLVNFIGDLGGEKRNRLVVITSQGMKVFLDFLRDTKRCGWCCVIEVELLIRGFELFLENFRWWINKRWEASHKHNYDARNKNNG